MNLSRYHLVWCDPQAIFDGADADILGAWFQRGRPAIIRRTQPCDEPGTIPAALTLPNDMGRRRIGFALKAEHVVRTTPPPQLDAALEDAPPSWCEGWPPELPALARVHGGLMWQHVTGEAYLRSGSDLDLLFWVDTHEQLDRAASLLHLVAGRSIPRVDGEIVFPDGSVVAWREWLSPAPTLLTKRPDGVAVIDRLSLLAHLSPPSRFNALPNS
jgi:phosphoribosyl-dephospho-CoA transferase